MKQIGWRCNQLQGLYMVFHVLVHLGWVEFDLNVPPSCTVAQPNSHQAKQNGAGSGTLKNQVNPRVPSR